MKSKFWLFAIWGIVVLSISLYLYNKVYTPKYSHKVVVCIPVYGQSLALGEEAVRITDFDSLRIKYDGRIVTENLDYTFGYYDHSSQFRQWVKRVLHYDKKAFELSVYSMAEELASSLGEDTMICVFPGGLGMQTIENLMKPSSPYNKFIKEIECAYKKSQDRGWDFYVPAICWMQGESDIAEYTNYDYKDLFHQMYNDLNMDIKTVTHQQEDIRIISYQTTAITKGDHYKLNVYNAVEPRTPNAQMELIRDDSLIWVSGPTYPYDFVREALHIDAEGQQSIGYLAAKSALGIIRKAKRNTGLIPMSFIVDGNDIHINYNVPHPPLCIDTLSVNKADNYGFNVIRPDGKDIISSVKIDNNSVIVHCEELPQNCKLRYGINGEYLKGGRYRGTRGNLRDNQIVQPNWSLIYDIRL